MALVFEATTETSATEGLAGAASSPNRKAVWYPSESERVRPDPDAREEVALEICADVCGSEVDDASTLDGARGDVAGSDESLGPVGRVGLDFVVASTIHAAT